MSYSCSEKLWKPIIRPPRHYYQLKDLGNQITMVMDTVTKRTDFEIVNKRKLTLQCSLFEPVRVQDRQHSCMIYLHGNSSSRVEALTILEYLIPYNIAVCGIDLSGSGHSEGVYISLGYYESQDVQSLINYLRDHKSLTQLKLDYGVDLWDQQQLFQVLVIMKRQKYQCVIVLFLIQLYYVKRLQLLVMEYLDVVLIVFSVLQNLKLEKKLNLMLMIQMSSKLQESFHLKYQLHF
ncbi:unnamed protein product [Paramecium sonneborni]|uniref:Uncharacterized protein n=1 Tax=Paramecium sonneborni TaxID=65129 RepID=A0A8S1R9L3_9CILI|nr:unnamed protein product [Paramecium sonneborni]